MSYPLGSGPTTMTTFASVVTVGINTQVQREATVVGCAQVMI